MKAVNLPLLVLFGLCYGLGHPSLAAYRPQLVDKTLASFHEDVNRTAVGASYSLSRIFEKEETELPRSTPMMASAPAPVVIVAQANRAAPVEPPRQRLSDVPRRSGGGFEVLSR